MGTWGPGPFDNDDAADMIAKLMIPIERVTKGKVNTSYHYSQARAAAKIVWIAHGTDILGGPSLDPILKLLEQMRNDVEWISGWRKPAEIRKALDREIRAVKRTIKTCCEPKAAAKAKRVVRRRIRRGPYKLHKPVRVIDSRAK